MIVSKQVRIACCRRFDGRLRKDAGYHGEKVGSGPYEFRAILGRYAAYRNDGERQFASRHAQDLERAVRGLGLGS
jgi:hypothetical protein